ncbi:MAG: hypothetical protein ACPGR2_06000 [Psychrobium sp.]
MTLLFRGVNCAQDKLSHGEIRPKGDQPTAIPCAGEPGVEVGAGYVCGYSIGNALRAHQVDSDMKPLAYVSTSTCRKVAEHFATKGGAVDGYVYVFDTDLFEQFEVVINELETPIYPGEQEVTIRSLTNGVIPESVIIGKELIKAGISEC